MFKLLVILGLVLGANATLSTSNDKLNDEIFNFSTALLSITIPLLSSKMASCLFSILSTTLKFPKEWYLLLF